MNIRDNWAFVLLAIWLILQGILQITSGEALTVLMGFLALAAGILFLLMNVRGVRR